MGVITIYHLNYHRRHYSVYFLFYGGTAYDGPGHPHWGWTITHGSTPLDVGSARRRNLYLTAQNPQNPASERPQTQALDRAATGICISCIPISNTHALSRAVLLCASLCQYLPLIHIEINKTGSVQMTQYWGAFVQLLWWKSILHIMNVCLWHCLSYSARNSQLSCAVLYCRLWSVWRYHIFPHIFS